MHILLPALLSLAVTAPSAEAPLMIDHPMPRTLDLREWAARTVLPADTRDPAQVERAREAMAALVAPYRQEVSVRLLLPRADSRERLLLATSQALKAQNPHQKIYLAFDPDMKALWDETAWGALDGGALLPGELGQDPSQWELRLTRAQELMPGRPWTLWLPQDPGPLTSALLGDGGRLVVPAGCPAALLAAQLPTGFTEVEGGRGDLTLRHPDTGEPRRWRFEADAWKPAGIPPSRNIVGISARAAYDVGALLAKLRATSLRDRSALKHLEASLAVDLHIQDFGGSGTDLGYRFRYFQKAGEPEELLRREVLFNGVRANLKGQAQLPVIEAKASAALPIALALTERYRYQDGGPGSHPGTRFISFHPAEEETSLYAGQLLVEEASGRILEERSHREGLPGMVKSESRVLRYGEPAPGLWALAGMESNERWFASGETVLVQRRMAFSEFKPNGQDFESARLGARGSEGAMMVQTPEGLRYYTRRKDGSREVDERSRTAGRAAGGFLLVDPSGETAVAPMGAMVFYDFDAWGKGIQYNFLTAIIFNAGSIAIPNAFWGFDVQSHLVLMPLKSTDRPVRNGRLLDGEGVGRRTQTGGVSIGHDLGRGFRFSADGDFELNQFSTPEAKYRTEGFALPPSGLDRRISGTLSWQGKGLMAQGSYGHGTRPEGSYGFQASPTKVPNHGDYRQWNGMVGYNLDLGTGHWLDMGLGQTGGSGFDRFKALEVSGMGSDAMAPGLKSGAIAADRVSYGRLGFVLPTGPNLRLTFKLGHVRMRSLDDQRTYSFTGLGVSGDLPGFWWFTTTRVDLGGGLQSQIPGVRSVNGTLTLLRVF